MASDSDNDGFLDAMDGIPSSGSGSISDGSVVASPGGVQTAIDNNTTTGTFGDSARTKIRLESGTDYTISSPWVVKNNVVIDLNGARVVPSGDNDCIHLMRNSGVYGSGVIDCQAPSSYSSRAITIGPATAGKIGTTNPAYIRDILIMGPKGTGTGSGVQYHGGNNPVTGAQAHNIQIVGFENGVDFFADGGDTSGSGDWCNSNLFQGYIQHSVNMIRLRSGGAAVSGNFVTDSWLQPNGTDSKWAVYQDDDPRDPGSTDFSDSNYNKRGNTFAFYPWDWNNVEGTNPYYDSSTDRRAPLWFIGRGQQEGNSVFDKSGRVSNEYLVNDADINWEYNGVLTGHGGDVRGTTQFTVNPTYAKRASKGFHPDGRN